MGDPRTRIKLDLQLAGNPVEGELAFEGSELRTFTGYAGLIAALESIRSDGDPADGVDGGDAEEEAGTHDRDQGSHGSSG